MELQCSHLYSFLILWESFRSTLRLKQRRILYHQLRPYSIFTFKHLNIDLIILCQLRVLPIFYLFNWATFIQRYILIFTSEPVDLDRIDSQLLTDAISCLNAANEG